MSIRWADPSDAKGIATVLVAAWQGAYRGLFPDEALDRLSLELYVLYVHPEKWQQG